MKSLSEASFLIYVINSFCKGCTSAANIYYSSAGHHEQKNKKTNSQIKSLAVTIKQQIKLSYNIPYVREC